MKKNGEKKKKEKTCKFFFSLLLFFGWSLGFAFQRLFVECEKVVL